MCVLFGGACLGGKMWPFYQEVSRECGGRQGQDGGVGWCLASRERRALVYTFSIEGRPGEGARRNERKWMIIRLEKTIKGVSKLFC